MKIDIFSRSSFPLFFSCLLIVYINFIFTLLPLSILFFFSFSFSTFFFHRDNPTFRMAAIRGQKIMKRKKKKMKKTRAFERLSQINRVLMKYQNITRFRLLLHSSSQVELSTTFLYFFFFFFIRFEKTWSYVLRYKNKEAEKKRKG